MTVVLGPDFFLLSETPYVSSQQDFYTSIPFPGQNEISISSSQDAGEEDGKGYQQDFSSLFGALPGP